jgi:arylformamidase
MTADDFALWPSRERDAAYDNTAAVFDSGRQLAGFESRSLALVGKADCWKDVRYGPAERQVFDYFPAGARAPTVLFIHGGYWQMRHKDTFRFVANGPLAHGINAALIGYTLAPQASLRAIVDEVVQGVEAVRAFARGHGASGDILLCGWSAGGHLTALGLACDGVVAGVGISGIYDLAPLRMTYLNRALQLSDEDVRTLSPISLPRTDKAFWTAFGTGELPQLQAQSLAFSAYRAGFPGGTLAIKGADHFSILDELADPGGAVMRTLCNCIGISVEHQVTPRGAPH